MHTPKTFLVVVLEVMYPVKLNIYCCAHIIVDYSCVNVSSSDLYDDIRLHFH